MAVLARSGSKRDVCSILHVTMARPVLEVNGASIVLAGSFNPAIFHPQWFVRQNLLPEEEAEKAEITVISPQVCQFQSERFVVQATPERFVAIAKPDTNPTPLRDLVLGTFFILEHTPLSAAGLNREMHFAMPSEETWNNVGDKLAPKDGWAGILQGRPGMLSLQIQGAVPDFPQATAGTRLVVKVEPSLRVKFGVYIQTNEHYNAPEGGASEFLLERIRTRWEGSYNYAAEIAQHIIDWAIGTDNQQRS